MEGGAAEPIIVLDPELEAEVERMLDRGFQRGAQDFQRRRAAVRFVLESADELHALEEQGAAYVVGTERTKLGFDKPMDALPAQLSGSELVIGGHQVMQDWEWPLMDAMAEAVVRDMGTGGFRQQQVLEIGFGLGISASLIQQKAAARGGRVRHTIVDCNPEICEHAMTWGQKQPSPERVTVIGRRWEDAMPRLGLYDAILFDPYSTSWPDIALYDRSQPYQHMLEFFPHASAHLRSGGVLTYFTGEVDSLGRNHQRELLRHFSGFEVSVVRGMRPPVGCQYWWVDSMAVVAARK